MLSTGYLAGMLWILLLAGFFAFVRPSSWRDLPGPLGYLALLAVLFAVVGNRGLIRNSIHYARFKVPPETVATRLEFDVWTKSASLSQLFWDTGQGFNEQQSARARHEPHWGLQTLQFELPPGPFRALRFDPLDGEGVITIRGVRVVDDGNRTRALLPRDCLLPEAQIAKLFGADDLVTIQTTAASHDPITGFTPEAVALINRARSTNAPAAR